MVVNSNFVRQSPYTLTVAVDANSFLFKKTFFMRIFVLKLQIFFYTFLLIFIYFVFCTVTMSSPLGPQPGSPGNNHLAISNSHCS